MIDIIIVILLILYIMRGASVGFSRQFFSFVGFWGGLLAAALLVPFVIGYGQSAFTKLLLAGGVVLIISGSLGALGEYLGARLSGLVARFNIQPVDKGLGGVFGAGMVGLGTWLLAAMLMNVPSVTLSTEIQTSKLVRAIDSFLPPAPGAIARIQRLIDPNGFPQVFLGPEPLPGTNLGAATQAEVDQAIAADRASMVKIEGIGCGGEVFGSGFAIGGNYFVTNAHVVAGLRQPKVADGNGRLYNANVTLFDPNLDIAVLRVSGLNLPALKLSTALAANGTHVVALGYPGGGSFTASGGSVIQHYIATGRNIYDSGLTRRQIYEVATDVEPGNSGGPLVTPDGTVVGVVFARSQTNNGIGYVLTGAAVSSDVQSGRNSSSAVSTGQCAAD
jgi:S1-C subfamily serine protease